MRDIAKEDLGPFDHGMTGGAEGHQLFERTAARLAMVDGEHGIGRASLAATAMMLIPREHLFAQAGEVPPVRPLPLVTATAPTVHVERGRAAAAEKHSLPQARAPGRTDRFPSLARFAFPARGGDAGRIVRSFSRQKPAMINRSPNKAPAAVSRPSEMDVAATKPPYQEITHNN